MAVYEYQGLDGGGKSVNGIIDADNPKAARLRIRQQGVFPTEIAEQMGSGGSATKGQGLSIEIDFSRLFTRIKSEDLANLTSQLSTLAGAGIPVVESLNALLEQTENPKLQIVLADIREKVNEGSTLADAMSGHPKVFGDLYVSMVRAGEASGALDVVLKRLAQYTEDAVRLQGKVTSAMVYPALMTLVGGGLVIGLFVFVIPKIKGVFDSFDATLPLITRIVLGASDVVAAWWWVLILLMVAAGYGFKRWTETEPGRLKFDQFKITVPIFGRILRLVAVSRFCRTLTTLLESGVPILKALGITSNVVGNVVLVQAIETASRNIAEGQSLAAPLRASGEFPPLVTHMIAIGEQTGELEAMLGKIADAYDLQLENLISGLTALLEPILIVIMGAVVGLVAVSILLPMLNLTSVVR
jgi:general secretion pathway protein F